MTPEPRPAGTEPPVAEAGATARPPRSARHQFASTMLVLEAFVVLFAALVAFGLRVAPADVVWGIGGGLVLALVLVAGMLRWPGGYVAGSVLQLAVVATGLAVPTMFVVGGIFAALWIVSLRLGARIDRERRERLAAGSSTSPAAGGAPSPEAHQGGSPEGSQAGPGR